MTIVRVGSTGKYAEGWDKAFGKSRGPVSSTKTKSAKNGNSTKAHSTKSVKSVKTGKKVSPKKPAAKKAGRKS